MQVKQQYGESGESLVKKFLRKIKKSDLIDRILERRYYKKPSQVAKEKEKARERVIEKLKEETRD